MAKQKTTKTTSTIQRLKDIVSGTNKTTKNNAKLTTNGAITKATGVRPTTKTSNSTKPSVKIGEPLSNEAYAQKTIAQAKANYNTARANNDLLGMRVANVTANKARDIIGAEHEDSSVGDKQYDTNRLTSTKTFKNANATDSFKGLVEQPKKSTPHLPKNIVRSVERAVTPIPIVGSTLQTAKLGLPLIKNVPQMFDEENYEDKFKRGNIGGGIMSLAGETLMLPQTLLNNASNNLVSLANGKGLQPYQRKMDFGKFENSIADITGATPISEKLNAKRQGLGEAYKVGMDILTDPLNLLDVAEVQGIKALNKAGSSKYIKDLKTGKIADELSKIVSATTGKFVETIDDIGNLTKEDVEKVILALPSPKEQREVIGLLPESTRNTLLEKWKMGNRSGVLEALADEANIKRGKNIENDTINATSTEYMADKLGLNAPKYKNRADIDVKSPKLATRRSEEALERLNNLKGNEAEIASQSLEDDYNTIRSVYKTDYLTNDEIDRILKGDAKINTRYGVDIEEKLRALDEALANDKRFNGLSAEEKFKLLDETGIGYQLFGDEFDEIAKGMTNRYSGNPTKELPKMYSKPYLPKRNIDAPYKVYPGENIDVAKSQRKDFVMLNYEEKPRLPKIRMNDEDIRTYNSTGSKKTIHKKDKQIANGNNNVLKTEGEVRKYIKDSMKGIERNSTKAYAKTPKRLIEKVKEATNGEVDLTGTFMELDSDKIKHSFDNHATPKRDGDIPLTEKDFDSLTTYINEFDEIIEVLKTREGIRIKLGKKINGHSVITEMFSNSRNSVKFNNMWGISTPKYVSEKNKRTIRYQASGTTDKIGNRDSFLSVGNGSSEPIINKAVGDVKKQLSLPKVEKVQKAEPKLPKNNKKNAVGSQANTIDGTIKGNAKKYGKFESGAPKGTAFGDTSKSADTLYKSMETSEGKKSILDGIVDGDLTKVTKKNNVTLQNASRRVEGMNLEEEYAEALKAGTGRLGANSEDVAVIANAIKRAEKAGDTAKVRELAMHYVDIASETGRTLQAMKLITNMSSEGRVLAVQRMARKIKAERGVAAKLSEETTNKILKATTEEEIIKANEEARKELWDQVPATFIEKMNAWRYLAMLGNPKTHIRNVLGNVLFMPVRGTKDSIATVVEKALLPVGERTKAFGKSTRADKNFVDEIWETKAKALYSGEGSKYVDATRPQDSQIFSSKFMNFLEKANSKALEKEDEAVGKLAFGGYFRKYMRANKISVEDLAKDSELLDKITNYALGEAKKSTFRDDNSLASAISQLKKKGYDKGASKGARISAMIVDSILPFAKTPINVLRRGIEYSPLEYGKLFYDMYNGNKTANQLIDEFASATTGSLLVGLGAMMYSIGAISGEVGSEKADYYEKDLGKQQWALQIGGNSYSIDWAVPSAMPFLLGVSIAENMSKEDKALSLGSLLEAVDQISQPLIETSMLQGVNDLIESAGMVVSSGTSGILPMMTNSAMSYASQYVPTVGGQIARSLDSTRRSNTSTAEGATERQLERSMNKIKGKIPVLASKNQPYIDMWGRTQENGPKDKALNALYQFGSPGYLQKAKTSSVDKEITRLMKAVPDERNTVAPSFGNETTRTSVDGVEYRFSEKEWTEYQKNNGQLKYKKLEKLFGTSEYKKASDVDKVKMIRDTYQEAKEEATADFLVSKGADPNKEYLKNLSESNKTVFDAVKDKVSAKEYAKTYGDWLKNNGSIADYLALAELGKNDTTLAMAKALNPSEKKWAKVQALERAGMTRAEYENFNKQIKDRGLTKLVDKRKYLTQVMLDYMAEDHTTAEIQAMRDKINAYEASLH